MQCFEDEYGIDGVNAPSTNLFLLKVDSVPGSAAVSGDDFIREAQIGCEEIIYEQMLTSTRSEVSHSKKHHDCEDEISWSAMEVCADADVDAECLRNKIRKARKTRM